jgi:ABC-type branched-subunit amino acid transport system ATPase component
LTSGPDVARFAAVPHSANGANGTAERLEVAAVSKAFGGVRALRGVDASVARGEIVGLVGPNGSGKTTLLNVISGVYAPDSGSVTVGEQDITGLSADRVARRGIARTFQNIRLFGELTVLQNVEVGAALAPAGPSESVVRTRARHDIEEMELAEVESRDGSTLAYGQQRRLELTRAMAARPRYLLLDEPAAGMNEAESDALLEAISTIRSEHGTGILVIDHDLRLIMRLCDRVIALNEGNVICAGTPQEVQADHAVIEAFLGTGHTSTETADGAAVGGQERRER